MNTIKNSAKMMKYLYYLYALSIVICYILINLGINIF